MCCHGGIPRMPANTDVRIERLQQLPKGDPAGMAPSDAALILVPPLLTSQLITLCIGPHVERSRAARRRGPARRARLCAQRIPRPGLRVRIGGAGRDAPPLRHHPLAACTPGQERGHHARQAGPRAHGAVSASLCLFSPAASPCVCVYVRLFMCLTVPHRYSARRQTTACPTRIAVACWSPTTRYGR